MGRSRNKQQPARRGAGLSSLRPRFDALVRQGQLVHPDDPSHAALDSLTESIKPDTFLPIVLSAAASAPGEAQPQLDTTMASWLSARGHLPALRALVERKTLDEAQHERALAWLAAAGEQTEALALEAWAPFYDAYDAGNDFQGVVMVFWYTSRRRHRVTGLSFLVDYEPPWEGAVKDGMRFPQRSPEAMITDFVDIWTTRGTPAERLTAADAKRRVLTALQQNRAQNIRIHPDLVREREAFIANVLSLPDAPETPALSVEEFDHLAREGRSPEALQQQEQLFGYQTRLPSGEQILVAPPDDLDALDLDEWEDLEDLDEEGESDDLDDLEGLDELSDEDEEKR